MTHHGSHSKDNNFQNKNHKVWKKSIPKQVSICQLYNKIHQQSNNVATSVNPQPAIAI